MNKVVSDAMSMEKCSSKIIDANESTESAKNGLVNGLVHNKSRKNKNYKNEVSDTFNDGNPTSNEVNSISANSQKNHIGASQENLVNSVGKSKKKAKKKKHKSGQLDSNENLNDNKLEETSNQIHQKVSYKSNSFLNIETELFQSIESKSGTLPLCSTEDICETYHVTSDIEKLVINDGGTQVEDDKLSDQKIEFVQYESELQMPMIMRIIQKDLSEPYSIYTYRYFIHNWPKLCFLAMSEGQCVGAIVCKLDLHRKVIRRGYIAMLAVDQNYRKLRIGSTLVQMAIHEMTMGDADEVVLETEVTNKPALKLYEKLGFVRDKRLFRYYLNGVDALRLKLWLR